MARFPRAPSLLQKRMDEFFSLPFLPGYEHFLARVLTKGHSPVFLPIKIGTIKLLSIEQCHGKAISKDRPKFLHEIERQRRPTGPIAMENLPPDRGRSLREPAVVTEQGIEE